jgi:hypothetical protein
MIFGGKIILILSLVTLKGQCMAKPAIKSNPRVEAIFDDLENYLTFCQDYDLYNWKSYAFQQFNKSMQGKFSKDMWLQDSRRGR